MENNKEIGKAFRKKLDQLDRTPNDSLWSKIDNDLDSKKKKKSIFWFVPLWIVSGLFLGGLCYTFYLTENDRNRNPENLQEKIVLEKNQEMKKVPAVSAEKDHASAEEHKAVTEAKKAITVQNNASGETKNTLREGNKAVTEEKYAVREAKKAPGEEKYAVREGKNTSGEIKQTITEQEKPSAERKSVSKTSQSKTGSNSVSYKTVQTAESARTLKKTKKLVKSTDEYDEYEVVQKYTYIVKKKKKIIRVPDKKGYHPKNKNQNHFSKSKPKSKRPSKVKKQPAVTTGFTLVENGKNNPEAMGTAIDTAAAILTVAAIEPKIIPKKELKKPIPEDSTVIEKEKKRNLYISPYFAPTAYESFAKGNSVSSRYQDNAKKATLTYSYGCYVRWMFNDKIGSRTGIGKTNLEYTTNIRKSNTGFIDTNNINLDSGITTSEINTHFENWVDEEVTMTQKLSYFEVPLEAYYAFTNRKIGIAASFGLSFLFLDENELALKSNSVNEYKIGSAKNVAGQSVTGNFRLILNYKLTESLRLDVSPSFQYHVLGFKDTTDFKPYILALQAGLSYRL